LGGWGGDPGEEEEDRQDDNADLQHTTTALSRRNEGYLFYSCCEGPRGVCLANEPVVGNTCKNVNLRNNFEGYSAYHNL